MDNPQDIDENFFASLLPLQAFFVDPGLTHEKLDKGTAIMYILHTGDTNDKAIF